MNSLSNQKVAKLLRSVAAALTIKKANTFQIRAYDNAADSIEHLDSEIHDLWKEGQISDIPGIGKGIQEYLNELFKTGEVKHFKQEMKSFKPAMFELLDIPGVGPKTAHELSEMGVESRVDLVTKIDNGSLVKKGFSEKVAQKLAFAAQESSANTGRMLLPFATSQAQKIIEYLKKSQEVIVVDPLGSLRRQIATIGDLDFAACGKNPEKIIEYFVKMPGISRVIDQGDNKVNVVLTSGLHIDLLVGKPESYGALLQHFTGGKNHNIQLRTLAEKEGLSLSEHGVKKNNTLIQTKTEDEFYKLLNMQTPPPQIREGIGEIELARENKLPILIQLSNIKGDFHLHSNYPFQSPSHGPGVNTLEEIVEKAIKLGYSYVGLTDHPPGFRIISEELLVKEISQRSAAISRLKSSKSIRVLNGLEIDILPNGTLSVPDSVLKTLDYSIAGVHSSHRMEKDQMTKRILSALKNPFVDILAHPTGRILNQRNSYEADWEQIFKYCAANGKTLEINSFPERLDLREELIKLAKSLGCKFIIDTDAHEISQMDNMPFGVSVAQRGWLEAEDVVNTWPWEKIKSWFGITF